MIVFGPVPSRRLGKSLGINNIPPKGCSYSCVYCQVGRTLRLFGCRPASLWPAPGNHNAQTQAGYANAHKLRADYGHSHGGLLFP